MPEMKKGRKENMYKYLIIMDPENRYKAPIIHFTDVKEAAAEVISVCIKHNVACQLMEFNGFDYQHIERFGVFRQY